MNVHKAIEMLFRGRLDWGVEPDARVIDERMDVFVSKPAQLSSQRHNKVVERMDISGVQL